MQYHPYIDCITPLNITHEALSINYRVSTIELRTRCLQLLFSVIELHQPSEPATRFVLFSSSWLVARSLSERISDFMLSDSLTV